MSLTVTLLGTGSPMPSPDRAGPATLVSAGEGADAEHYLVDAGRGVLMRLAALGLGAPNLAAVLITHLHSDHITDLNDVITALGHDVQRDPAHHRRPRGNAASRRPSACLARARHRLSARPSRRPRPSPASLGDRGRRG
ncbi:MAG: MBL fold metallo-hydrolase [Acidimicrobiales bacterium]